MILIIFYFIYVSVIQKPHNKAQQPKKLTCIKLNNCISSASLETKQIKKTKKTIKKTPKHHTPKKTLKKHSPKHNVKKLPQKKVFLKKQKTKKEPPVKKKQLQQPPLEEKQPPTPMTTSKEKQQSTLTQPIVKKQQNITTSSSTTKTPLIPKRSYQKEYLDQHLNKIRELIAANIYYPRKARRRHIEGKVILRVILTQNGKIKQMEVVTSVSPTLSHAAKQVMIMIEDQLPHPKEEIDLTIPFIYQLH